MRDLQITRKQFILCGILILLCLNITIYQENLGSTSPEKIKSSERIDNVPSYSPSSPIIIQSNADFETQSWPGSGTEEEPFLIENLNITNDNDCISISFTTVYFTIRGCYISSSSTKTRIGILLNQTSNGLVQDCWIEGKFRGYQIESSTNCEIRNCTAWDNDNYGFYLLYSDQCVLENNTAESQRSGFFFDWSTNCRLDNNVAVNNSWSGFGLSFSEHNNLTGNKAQLNSVGFQLYESQESNLMNNIATWNYDWDGFLLEHSQKSTMENCIASNNNRRGIYLFYSPVCRITNNSVSNNGFDGVYLRSSGGTVLSGNRVYQNPGDGFYLWNSDGCSLSDNNASLNLENGIHILSSDECILTGNTMVGNDIHGTFFELSSDIIMIENLAENNEDGFYVYDSDNSTLIRNIAHKNMDVGIELHYSDNCTVISNQVSNQTHHGIWVRDSGSGCRLYYNLIMHNGVNPSYYNAIDSGSSNIWDDSVDLGNFWSDYGGTGTYPIIGTASAEDRYPQTAEYYITEFPPTIDHPNDVEFEVGSQENTLTWIPRDYSPDSYIIFRNESILNSGEWNGSAISIDLDGLEYGIFNYTLLVNDTYNNWLSDTVIVMVVDTIPPLLSSPGDMEYEVGEIGNELVWYPVDLSPDFYELYIDSVFNETGLWPGVNISISIDGLDVGVYNYTLVIVDKGGNSIYDTVVVTVTEPIPTTTTTTTSTTSTSTSTSTTTTEPTTSSTTTLVEFDPTLFIFLSSGVIGVLVIVILLLKSKQK